MRIVYGAGGVVVLQNLAQLRGRMDICADDEDDMHHAFITPAIYVRMQK
jgi:hypothetical protein